MIRVAAQVLIATAYDSMSQTAVHRRGMVGSAVMERRPGAAMAGLAGECGVVRG